MPSVASANTREAIADALRLGTGSTMGAGNGSLLMARAKFAIPHVLWLRDRYTYPCAPHAVPREFFTIQ